ncbi:MAG: LPS export ABC transporter periplasmic protein LptC [Mesorhizobium sp.]
MSAAQQETGRLPMNAARHRDRQFVGAMRHSRRVRFFKIALPLASLAIALGFAGYSWMLSPASVAIVVDGSAIRDGKIVMANPKMSGFTKDNLPYAMNAARAIQELSRTGGIELEEIDAKFPIAADKWAKLNADSGVYDDETNTLRITSPIFLETSDGLKADLGPAEVDISAGEMRSPSPVRIEQNGSTITADSLEVLDKGTVFVFENRVRVQVDPRTVRGSDVGADNKDAGQ